MKLAVLFPLVVAGCLPSYRAELGSTSSGDASADGDSLDAASDTGTADGSVDAGDPKNCGPNAQDCLGGLCLDGVCQPALVEHDIRNGSDLALGDSEVFFSTTKPTPGIYACPKYGDCGPNQENRTVVVDTGEYVGEFELD